MLKFAVVAGIIFALSVVMTMAGRGGGNFYVPVLVLAGMPMYQAASTCQFILATTAFAALLVFQKNKIVSWPLAVLIGPLTALSALAGGYNSHLFSAFALKMIFGGMLTLAGLLMFFPIREKPVEASRKRFGYWHLKSGMADYRVNLWLVVPVVCLSGFGSGMVGVSGGSFLVPLMVLACRVPMKVAVGTASGLIGVTALMGFGGHALRGDFNPHWAIPLAAFTIVGGLIGGKMTLKARPQNLKTLFAVTTLIAAAMMVANGFYAR